LSNVPIITRFLLRLQQGGRDERRVEKWFFDLDEQIRDCHWMSRIADHRVMGVFDNVGDTAVNVSGEDGAQERG
jgi:hypothetical protein